MAVAIDVAVPVAVAVAMGFIGVGATIHMRRENQWPSISGFFFIITVLQYGTIHIVCDIYI